MKCAWQAYLDLLPPGIRSEIDKHGKEDLLELRMRIGMSIQLKKLSGSVWLDHITTKEDLSYCINVASKYSPWSVSSAKTGYITASGGHRIGLCGSAVVVNGELNGIHTLSSLCIRVARDFPGCAKGTENLKGSVLIIGRPGSGKTTLLRDVIRYRSEKNTVCVVDEKGEVFPFSQDKLYFPVGMQTDVIYGVSKERGVDMLLRNMSPDTIAVDEITAPADCAALLKAGWCGVDLIATAHASDVYELKCRSVYRPIVESGLFDTILVMQSDKSWRVERMKR